MNMATCQLSRKIDDACPQMKVLNTVKHVLRVQLKIDKIKVLMENDSLMKDESIAECSP